MVFPESPFLANPPGKDKMLHLLVGAAGTDLSDVLYSLVADRLSALAVFVMFASFHIQRLGIWRVTFGTP